MKHFLEETSKATKTKQRDIISRIIEMYSYGKQKK